jgi:hypothetical protein
VADDDGQLWYDHRYFAPTELGYSLESADRVWVLVTPAGPHYREHEATYFYLARWRDEDAKAPWISSHDPIEGDTPIFISLRDARRFLEETADLPDCEWLPITQGDLWRRWETGKCRRRTSEKTLAAIQAANNQEENK